MKKTYYFSLIALSFIFLQSCRKVSSAQELNSTNNLPSILDYYNLVTKPTNGSFGLSFSSSMRDKDNKFAPVLFAGTFYKNGGGTLPGGHVKFGNLDFLPGANNFYGNGTILDPSYTGKLQKFSLEGLKDYDQSSANFTSDSLEVWEDSLYVPEIVNVTAMPTNPEAERDSNSVWVGSNIQWEPDPHNVDKGMIIGVTYSPKTKGNENFATDFPNVIQRGLVIPDDGAYRFTNDFFGPIPVGAIVTVTLGRANYTLTTNSSNTTLAMWSYNYKYFDFVYKQ